MRPDLVPLHFGALHPFEQALTFLLAFGPIVVLAIVIRRRQREDAREEERKEERKEEERSSDPGGWSAQR